MTDYFTNDPRGLKEIEKRTRLYKVDSFWFLENYQVKNKINHRFGMLYNELYKTYPNFKKTINVYELEINDIPDANGIKTILDTYFILKQGSITSPLSVNYNKWGEFGIEPGGKRAALLPYLPRHDFYIAVFNRFQYIDAKYEVDISILADQNLRFCRQPVHTLDNPEKENTFYDSLIDEDWRSKILDMCKEQKIIIQLENDKVYINNDVLLYRQDEVHLCAKNLFEEYTRKKNDKSNTSM